MSPTQKNALIVFLKTLADQTVVTEEKWLIRSGERARLGFSVIKDSFVKVFPEREDEKPFRYRLFCQSLLQTCFYQIQEFCYF